MKLNAFVAEKKRLMDRTQDPRAACGRILDAWGYDLDKRKLGVAFEDPDKPGRYTINREMAVYVAALANRRAVITVNGRYRNWRASTRREGEVVVSKENRHGQVMGITSNKDLLNFNVLVNDADVVTTDEIGKPRNFTLQGPDGQWYDGWRSLQLIPKTEAEKALFRDADEVSFDHFIHPNRWSSFYSRYYLLAKLAIDRLADQVRFLKAEQKRIRTELEIPPPEWAKTEKVGAEKKVSFWAFNAVVEGGELVGDYTGFETTPEGLEDCTLLRKRCEALLTQLRFHTRATEFAFWQHAIREAIPEDQLLDYLKNGGTDPRQPAWAKGEWQTGYKEKPKARTFWARMEREHEGLALRWRCWQKSERVAA